MAQFEIEDGRVPLLVTYEWTPLRPATRHSPEEGGVDDIQVFVQHSTDPKRNVNITDFLNQEALDYFSELCYDHGEGEEENRKALVADAMYDRKREEALY